MLNFTSIGKSSYPNPWPNSISVLSQIILPIIQIGLRGLPTVTCQSPVGSPLIKDLVAAVPVLPIPILPKNPPIIFPNRLVPIVFKASFILLPSNSPSAPPNKPVKPDFISEAILLKYPTKSPFCNALVSPNAVPTSPADP